ncbi:hypothetical protein [Mucilaginibacter paludis]|uniref:Uncharacterized protein n=1 Tax=Mucilaginibacter paludis DSM 18603 TaxID=714943 RepID=H1Y316_9SPHI|nr:hypothetical protein [Mucilaginibacter paludis]EHQ28834.1 hypothetical protein Mucpa_4749 [Mucilaginibacter paludis DSM 18603]
MKKTAVLRIIIVLLMFCLLAWDSLMVLTGSANQLPEQHKQLLLTAFLLWLVTTMFNQNRNDDDWAGQF